MKVCFIDPSEKEPVICKSITVRLENGLEFDIWENDGKLRIGCDETLLVQPKCSNTISIHCLDSSGNIIKKQK